MLFSSGAAVSGELSEISSEPANCYRIAWNNLALTTGQAQSYAAGRQMLSSSRAQEFYPEKDSTLQMNGAVL
jgi:hypothetical protein